MGTLAVLYPGNALGIQMQQATFEMINLTYSKASFLAEKLGRGFWNPPPKSVVK